MSIGTSELEHLRRAGYNTDGWGEWQRGKCGTYACALIGSHPHLRLGVLGEPTEDGWWPIHYFAHDDTHAYDSAGRHPLPYHGLEGKAALAELGHSPLDWGLPDEESGPEGPDQDIAAARAHARRHGILEGRFERRRLAEEPS